MLTVVGTVAFDTTALVPRLPEPEATAGVLDLHVDLPGGTGGNVALALARLGLPPRLVAAVGPDFAGSAYEARLSAAGVDLSLLQRVAATTSRGYIVVDADGRQVTFFHAGASRLLSAAHLPGRVHFAAGEVSAYPALMAGAEWVSFDPGQEVHHRNLEEILACLPHVDLLFVNRTERQVLESRAGWSLEEGFDRGIAVVVESRGAEGTLVHTPQGRFAAPAVPATARDPTGAGDAHRAGFLFALEKGADLGTAARLANVLGAFAVESVGAQEGLPSLDEAVARYEKAYSARPFP